MFLCDDAHCLRSCSAMAFEDAHALSVIGRAVKRVAVTGAVTMSVAVTLVTGAVTLLSRLAVIGAVAWLSRASL